MKEYKPVKALRHVRYGQLVTSDDAQFVSNEAFTGKDMVSDVTLMLQGISDKDDKTLKHTAGLILLYVATQFKAKLKGE